MKSSGRRAHLIAARLNIDEGPGARTKCCRGFHADEDEAICGGEARTRMPAQPDFFTADAVAPRPCPIVRDERN